MFQTFGSNFGFGLGCGLKPKIKINSEFNSIHFGIEINNLRPISFWVLNNVRKILEKFL